MRIVLIHGQNHQGSSCRIGRMIAEKITSENEITEFFLPRDLNHFCTGCYSCIDDDSRCPYAAEKRSIMDAVEQAELLIFTTPTYCLRASSPMKAFIELNFTYWMVHRPRACMFGKRAVVVSTAAGMGTGSAIKDVATALEYWGVPEIMKYGISVQAAGWEMMAAQKKAKIEKDTDRIAAKLSSAGKPRVGFKTRMLFSMMRMMQRNNWGSSPAEKEYWGEKGWLGKERPWKK
ncbi:MAG: NAD(P)H-dependent oxidoreductase [Clostridia bacterium]|nr:NAD(P)H-dependent oxidoreductase [Clostridia bacterium]